MQDRRGEGSSSKQRRNHLPPLAPRDSRPPATRERTTATTSGRPPRLSHRSRAGCWTCRGRKVKCDEQHPRCGPCTRLNRDCDWDHRWNFSDATTSTQGKYGNVNTSGNAVWDPSVRDSESVSPVLREQDDLPDFAVLTSDEDRERKAGTQKPGTFGVIVTPESFHDLPEYAAAAASSPYGSRRTSAHSSRGGYGSPRPGITRSTTLPDSNTVILDKFEDVSPVMPVVGPFSVMNESRRGSYSEGLQRLSISSPTYTTGPGSTPLTPTIRSDDHLSAHFRQYIVPRLVQPQQDSASGIISQGSTKDVLEREAARFPPLHHAICAISALNLANSGRLPLEDAMQHYGQALATPTTGASPNDLLSDGVFFRHFLLFIYDICIPMQADDGADMWAQHLYHLRRIAMQRHHTNGHEPYAYTLWTICEIDMYACLMGSGNCEFIQTIRQHNMLPPLEQQVPCLTSLQTPGAGAFLPHEMGIFPAILHLNEGIVLRTAKLAQTAQAFRAERSQQHQQRHPSPQTFVRWQATTSQLQNDLHTFWQHAYPPGLRPSSLPERPRAVLANATLLYHSATIYSRTSMFPPLPTASQHSLSEDTEGRIGAILFIANQSLTQVEKRNIIFPLFIAGFASKIPEAKFQAINLIKQYEGYGIGQNTYRTRVLLEQVCEEQRRVMARGGRMEDVEWLVVARERGLGVVNCGL